MTINLEDYLEKTVEVELRNGRVIGGHKIYRNCVSSSYKYVLGSYLNFYNQDGMNNANGNYDIIKIIAKCSLAIYNFVFDIQIC